jgi:hypothetical protein
MLSLFDAASENRTGIINWERKKEKKQDWKVLLVSDNGLRLDRRTRLVGLVGLRLPR